MNSITTKLVLSFLLLAFAFVTNPQPVRAAEVDLSRGLVASFPLAEGQGDIVSDQSDNALSGKIQGAAWAESPNDAALDFDGAREQVDCNDDIATRLPGPLSVSAWVRPLTSSSQNVVSRGDWSLGMDSAGKASFTARPAKNRAWDATQTILSEHPIQPNKWSLLTAVYDTQAGEMRLYVDGELAASADKQDGAVGGGFRSRLLIGGGGYTGLIAGVRVYDRPLSPAEVKTLFERRDRDIDIELASKTFRIGLRPHYLYQHQAVLAEVYLRNSGSAEQVSVLEAELVRPDPGSGMVHNNTVVGTARFESKESLLHADLKIPVAGLEPGRYVVRIVAKREDGSTIDERSESVEIPAKPWWNEAAARRFEPKVLAPWTPLEAKSDASGLMEISCWGRRHDIKGSGFTSQIESAGAELLARPIELVAMLDGKRVQWQVEPGKITKTSDAKVGWTRKLTSEKLDVDIKASIEYDGMLLFDVKVTPREKVKLDRMWLEIPFRESEASHYYFMRDSTFQGPGKIPRGGLTRKFNQAVWIGNEQRGLQWFAESPRDWLPSKSDRAIEIRPVDEEVMLRVHFIGAPIPLDPMAANTADGKRTLEYRFGMEATPVRPVSNTAWDSRTVGATDYGDQYSMLDQKVDGKPVLDYYQEKGVKTVFLVTSWTEVFSYPLNVGHKAELHRMTEECHKRGIQVVLYLGPQFSDAAPEFPAFLDDFVQWSYPRQPGAPMSYYSYPDNTPPGKTQIAYEPCIGSEWRYFLLAGAEKLMVEFDIDGFYLDGVSLARECYNPFHDCGIHDHGNDSIPTVPLLAGREFIQRLYAIVKAHKPDGQVQLHPGSAWFAPVMGWSTVVWDGETILGDNQSPTERKKAFLLDYLTLDMFRAQYMGRQWGVASEFLSYYIPLPYREVLALTLPHDVLIRPNGTGFRLPHEIDKVGETDLDVAASLWKLGEEFGRSDAEWLPYWSNAKYVTLSGDGAIASVYRHDKNGVLAVVSNLAKTPQQIDCTFNLAELGLSPQSQVRDALTGESLEIKDGRVSLALPSLGWKILRIPR